jgi:hypothetical protein
LQQFGKSGKKEAIFFAKSYIVIKYYEAFCKKASKLKWIEKIVKNELDMIKKELQNDACIIGNYTKQLGT